MGGMHGLYLSLFVCAAVIGPCFCAGVGRLAILHCRSGPVRVSDQLSHTSSSLGA